MHGLPEFTTFGVDYLTVTASVTGHCVQMATIASGLFRFQRDCGFESRPWSMLGFKGFQCGGIQIGRDDKRALVRLSGDLAREAWRRLYEVSDTTSRVDIQCTSRTDGLAERRIARAFAEATRYASRKKNKPNVKRIWNNKTGTTVYLGSRLSNAYGRIYNKGLESGLVQLDQAVRAEVEYHNKAASFVAHEMFVAPSPLDVIPGYVSRFFADRGVKSLGLEAEPLTFCLPRKTTDHDRRLRWLREQVQPSVRLLINDGRVQDVLDALGLA